MADMTAEQMLPLLREWHERHAELHEHLDKLDSVFRCCDGPLLDAIYHVWSGYTEQLSERFGDTDHHWLTWYELENGMGKRKMTAGYGKRVKRIKSLEDLAWLLVMNQKAAKKAQHQ